MRPHVLHDFQVPAVVEKRYGVIESVWPEFRQCREFFALEGISQLMDTVDKIRESFAHALQIEGILLTMYDERTNLGRQVAEDLRDFFADEVLSTVIPRSIRLAEAPSYGKPILMYDPRSRGAESYIKLAKEILENEQRRRQTTQSAR